MIDRLASLLLPAASTHDLKAPCRRAIGSSGSGLLALGPLVAAPPRLALAASMALSLALGAMSCDDTPSGAQVECAYNSECPEDQICARGRCAPECLADRDCPSGACVEGACAGSRAEDAGEPDSGSPEPDDIGSGDSGSPEPDDAARSEPDAQEPDVPLRPEGEGEVSGTVHFRLWNGRILPVAHPIVYWTLPESPPLPLNPQASCDCAIPERAVIGNVDGTFVLRGVPAGPILLVVQKGHFRRSRVVNIEADVRLRAPAEVTELPAASAPERGDEIPKIAIGTGRFDAIEDVFAKLRMGPITPTFGFDHEAWMADPSRWGVELLLYQQPRDLDDRDRELIAEPFLALLQDPARLRERHFVFAPCADGRDYSDALTDPRLRGNLEGYVNAGGKLYVTDFAYDLLEQTWPGYVDFLAPEGRDGNADGHVGERRFMQTASSGTLMYSSENRALDSDLAAWLAVLGVTSSGLVETEGNWVNLGGVGSGVQCCDEDRMPVEVTPEVVMSGPNGVDDFFNGFGPSHERWSEAEAEGANRPHTLRFPYGCGQVMYSTYHTVDFRERIPDLAPQELVLLYLILEINECNLHPIKAPPGE